MKKVLFVILTFLLALCLLAGCGTYKPPIILDDPYGEEENPTNPPGGTTPDPDGEEHRIYTVTLYSEGKRFSPNVTFYAQWISEDKTEIVSAPFDKLGVAQTQDLDGEYRVTLSGLPDDYTYDPNGIFVDNDKRDVNIELLPIITTAGEGPNYGNSIKISRLGTYRKYFSSQDQRVWYQYIPTAQGKYAIESWVDVTENEINPRMEWYYGNSGGFVNTDYPAGSYDGGGTSSTFTKNFRFELELSNEMVGNTWYFELHADCKGEYPIYIDFTIRLIGDYSGNEEKYDPVLPNGPYLKDRPDGTWTYNYRDNNKVLDSSRFKLNEDGFYYLYDETVYAANGGWGPMLYTKLNKDSEVLSADGLGFSHPLVRLRFAGKDYNAFMDTYFTYCNSDGAHPVNQELREFLQLYASSQSLFADGESLAEIYLQLSATEEDMWLFGCGYYK